jgi:hypothetical protein
LIMSMTKAYEEVIDFIAAGSSPCAVIDFRSSEAAKARVLELVAHEKTDSLRSFVAESSRGRRVFASIVSSTKTIRSSASSTG